MTTESCTRLLSLASVASKKTLLCMEHLYYKDFDVNELIQHDYYFFSYCAFISNFQFSQFNLQQRLPCVYIDGERNFRNFLGHNKRHKYGLINQKLGQSF